MIVAVVLLIGLVVAGALTALGRTADTRDTAYRLPVGPRGKPRSTFARR